MATKTTTMGQVFLLDRARSRPSGFSVLHPQVVSSIAELRGCMAISTRDSLWVSYSRDLTEALVRIASTGKSSLGFGLFVHPVESKTIPALSSLFRRIAFATDGGFVSASELAEILASEHRADLFIGGSVDRATNTITFWRGNLASLTVPFSAFETSGDGTEPNFDELAVIDCGQTVKFGDYEAAVDAILYEYDPVYRRRISKRRLQRDRSFGASLRRLRKQRGLRREDFEPDISAKTVARIEQGKVQRIQKRTLEVLADRLSVAPKDIGSF